MRKIDMDEQCVPSDDQLALPDRAAYRRKLPHYQRAGATYFVTFATASRFVLPPVARDEVLACCVNDHRRRYFLQAAVVMPDHVHILITPKQDPEANTFGLTEILQSLKGASAHAVNRAMTRKGPVWEQESFDRIVRSDEVLRAKAEYICENPVRAGLAGRVDDYRRMWRYWINDAENDGRGRPSSTAAR